MPDEPETKSKPARRRPLWVAFVAAGVGVVLLNEAADSVHVHAWGTLIVVQVFFGIACLALAVLWGTKRI